MRGVLHGIACVEQYRQQTVRFAPVALQVRALGPRIHVPIDVTQIVARRIRAVLGEFLAEAEVRRAMQARDEAVDDRLGDEVQSGNRVEHSGIEKPLHQEALGGGVTSISRRKISSESMRSDSA